MSRSERKFYDIGGFVSEGTKENRRQILAQDELFMEDGNQQQQEDEEHQQQLEEDENGN